MRHVTPEMRKIMVMAKKEGKKTKEIAEFLGVSRKTVWKWVKRAYHPGKESFRDKSRKPHHIHKKVDPIVENAIIILRDSFNWGTERIKLALAFPPPYIKFLLEHVLGKWENIEISRQTINNVLKKHRRNGSPYKRGKKNWHYFRAKTPNDLWQMDIKGSFRIEGKKQYALIIIDDNSRYILHCNIYDKIRTKDVIHSLKKTIEKYGKPRKILVDNDTRFAREFEKWCRKEGIEVEHTPPYYPQAKGKIERAIRTFNEEFLKLRKVFKNILSLLQEFIEWFNNHRYHMGIHDYPAKVYFSKNVTDVT